MKCIAIFLVLWGHAIGQLMNHPVETNRVYMWIYSFHMPLFMMMSGFFARSSMKLDFKTICLKKFRQVVLPALSFGVIWYIHDVITGHRPLSVKGFLFLEAEGYWFLKSLFFAYLAAWVTFRFRRWKVPVAILTCLLFMVLQHYGQTFFKMGIMLPCFYAGMVLRHYIARLENHKGLIGWSCAIVYILLFPFFTGKDLFANKFFLEYSLPALGHWAFCLTMGLTGSLATLCGCMYIDKHFGQSGICKLLTQIGTCTLGIYLTQKIFLELLLSDFVKVNMHLTLYNLVLTPVVAIAFLFICYYTTLALKKFRWTSLVFLGEK